MIVNLINNDFMRTWILDIDESIDPHDTTIYCRRYDCQFNEALPEGEEHKFGEDRMGGTSLGDTYKGKCSLRKIFMDKQEIETRTRYYHLTDCKNFAQRKIAGHEPWPGMQSPIEGGNISSIREV